MTAPRPVPLPLGFLGALEGRDEVLVSSRSGPRWSTVPMSFAVAPPGVLYLLTSAFSRKALRWDRDPWVRLAVPGGDLTAEGAVTPVRGDEVDAATESAILERFADSGAATPEALRQLLESGTHRLFRIGGESPGSR